MSRLIQSPGKYIQAAGAMAHLQEYTKEFGRKFMVLATDSGLGRVKDKSTEASAELKVKSYMKYSTENVLRAR